MAYKKIKDEDKKYRISIINAMDEKKTRKYGFELAYIIFERSVNRQEKSGDLAELKAVQYLKDNKILSDNYVTNKVICLNSIKIEADIIDFDNKIIYETKSRKTYELSKSAIRDKWMTFEYDKAGSNYSNFKLHGIIVVNTDKGPIVKKVFPFNNSTVNQERMKKKFDQYFETLSEFKKIKKKKNVKRNNTKSL